MVEGEQKEKPAQVQRTFEQGPDAVSFYSDFTQVINSGSEIVFQFYETIPGPPGPAGRIQNARTRLRATIQVSFQLAKNLANNVLTQTPKEAAKPGAAE